MSQPKKFVLLGATGSIGENTLRVLRKHSDKLQLVGISARKQADKLAEIAHEFSVPYACLEHPPESGVSFPDQTKLLLGQEGIESLAALDEADTTVVAVVGAAGLLPTLSAVKAGKNIVLANKEALVVGGEMVMQAATRYGATIIPRTANTMPSFNAFRANRIILLIPSFSLLQAGLSVICPSKSST